MGGPDSSPRTSHCPFEGLNFLTYEMRKQICTEETNLHFPWDLGGEKVTSVKQTLVWGSHPIDDSPSRLPPRPRAPQSPQAGVPPGRNAATPWPVHYRVVGKGGICGRQHRTWPGVLGKTSVTSVSLDLSRCDHVDGLCSGLTAAEDEEEDTAGIPSVPWGGSDAQSP